MKVLLAAAVAAGLAAGASTTAMAADLPSRRAPPVYFPPPAIPVFTWTGFYAGVNAGYAFNGNTAFQLSGNNTAFQRSVDTGARPAEAGLRSSGFTGGGQIGYNYQLSGFGMPNFGLGSGGVVVGVEADAAYTDLDRTADYTGVGGQTSTLHAKTDFVGTVRGRVGYAFNTLMIYGTGGFAYGGVRDSMYFTSPAGPAVFSGSRDTLKGGYTYGGGVEYAIPTASFLNVFHSSAITLKAEYLHYDLGTSSYQITSNTGAGAGFTAKVRTTGSLVRAGINYKFDMFGSPSPVVARY